ncbi:histidine-containing phosphotransfer protein 1-like [Malania oleifera]|uniref:histidine-containing phosphotransfer protein 1-like n=1 Tax=Malania oleifera TaxID=397392 RepID=UPI0025ADBF90|nr:histidine-containing phosphotransfer protein 1-like [Malania oleifera]
MDVSLLQRQLINYRGSLYNEGILDDQFNQLQSLQDESNPYFVVEVVCLFFEDSEKLLNNLTITLEQPIVDFKKVDSHVHQFKGSSSSIGAQRIKNICMEFRSYCEAQNLEGCRGCLQKAKNEYLILKGKLETLFGLERQILTAGGSIPMEQMG